MEPTVFFRGFKGLKKRREMTEYVKHRGLKIPSVYQRHHSPHEWA